MNAETTTPPPTNSSQLKTRSSLIRNLADPAQGTRWDEFDSTYRGIVFGMARRAGLSHHDSEDVTQEVFRDLARSICGFEVRDRPGAFRRYLFNLVRWRVSSRFDRQKREAERAMEAFADEDAGDPLDSMPAPEAPAPASATDFREVVTQAMLALARDLPARHVQVLELYFCREWPARRVGEALRMPAATVFTIAHRHKIRFMREILCRL